MITDDAKRIEISDSVPKVSDYQGEPSYFIKKCDKRVKNQRVVMATKAGMAAAQSTLGCLQKQSHFRDAVSPATSSFLCRLSQGQYNEMPAGF